MAIEKALFLALLVALVLLGQSAAHARTGGTAQQPLALPDANSGLAADSAMTNPAGLPARR